MLSTFSLQFWRALSALNLLLKDTLESDSIGCEFRDAFSKLLDSHCLLIEVKSEERLIVEVTLLWDVEALCVAGDKLLWDLIGRVEEILKVVGLQT